MKGFAGLLQAARKLATHPPPMYLVLSKKPRKSNRSKTKRFRAGLKAKNKARRSRVYQGER
jgi:hypothetical protein